MIPRRWQILVVDVQGGIHDPRRFVFRRNAERYGRSMASPLYNVVLVGPGVRQTLSAHMDPNELLRIYRETGSVPSIFSRRPL